MNRSEHQWIETDLDGELRNWTFFKDANGNPRVILCSSWGDGHFAIYDLETGKHVTETIGWGEVAGRPWAGGRRGRLFVG